MITHIIITNYALIDRIEIDLRKGFTAITGETGAGKSILLGAIGLTLGQRAEIQAITDKSRKCIVEITYDITGYDLANWFTENDLDYDTQVMVRRELFADGKSRGFINDTPVNNKLLKELGSYLIDVHSQHQSLLIGRPEYQLEVLDAFCGNIPLLGSYAALYNERNSLLLKLKEIRIKAVEAEKEEDYLKFQFNQLDAAHLRPEEQQELEEELTLLNNAENIKSAFSTLTLTLTGTESSLVQQLRSVKNRVSALRNVVKEAADYEERIQSVILELEDMSDEAERKAESVEYSSQRIQSINERLNLIYDLLHKHKCDNLNELIALKDEMVLKISGIASFAAKIEELCGNIGELEQQMDGLADRLHASRTEGKVKLEENMKALLVDLGIKHARFSVSVETNESYTPTGRDSVAFLFTANKNQDPGELSKIASGGEISRLMLSMKYILSGKKQLPTIIFDEIDTGVSGEIAHRMALIMKNMSRQMQVIAITHLPQIAASGNTHLKVYKEELQQHIVSRIKELSREERVSEIAGMISSSEVSDAAIQTAEQLLGV